MPPSLALKSSRFHFPRTQEGRKKAPQDGKSNGMPSSMVMKELAEMEEPEDHSDPTLERTGR